MNTLRLAAPDCLYPRRPSVKVDRIVIHTMEGSFAGTVAWFTQAGRKPPTAAHYLFSRTGSVCQMVPDHIKCYHAGSTTERGWNDRSIGFEHEGYAAATEWPEAMLAASARCAAVLCRKFAIAVDREHIVGHVEVPGVSHTDPGAHWPWDRYMALVVAAAG
jgi:N-acetyl-anhydromuramyl-L-alanine amidase AmpD